MAEARASARALHSTPNQGLSYSPTGEIAFAVVC